MPTPDASAFTRQAKFNAINERGTTSNNGTKPVTHLTSYVPKVTGLSNFLPSFSNKVVSPCMFVPINSTQKPKKPIISVISTSVTLNQGYVVTSPYSVASSSNGQTIYFGGNGSTLSISYDGGLTWINTISVTLFSQVACSSDGTKVLYGDYNYYIQLSTNSGTTFSSLLSYGSRSWIATTMSSNGTYMYCGYEGGLYRSIDGGSTFSSLITGAPFNYPCRMACDSTGQYVYTINRGDNGTTNPYISYSSDYGVTWTTGFTLTGTGVGRAICCSSNGQIIYAGFTFGTSIYVSTNYGVTWNAISTLTLPGHISYSSINCSSNGSTIVVGQYSPSVGYVSYDYGTTWITATGAPTTNTIRAVFISPDASTIIIPESNNYLYINKPTPIQYLSSSVVDNTSLATTSGSGTYNGATITYGAVSTLRDNIMINAWYPSSLNATGSLTFNFASSVTISRIRIFVTINGSGYCVKNITSSPLGISISGLTLTSYTSLPNGVEAYYDCTFTSTTLTTLSLTLSANNYMIVNELQFFSY